MPGRAITATVDVTDTAAAAITCPGPGVWRITDLQVAGDESTTQTFTAYLLESGVAASDTVNRFAPAWEIPVDRTVNVGFKSPLYLHQNGVLSVKADTTLKLVCTVSMEEMPKGTQAFTASAMVDATATTIATCPGPGNWQVDAIYLAGDETSTNDRTCVVYKVASGGSASAANIIGQTLPVAPNDTLDLEVNDGLYLRQNETIQMTADSNNQVVGFVSMRRIK